MNTAQAIFGLAQIWLALGGIVAVAFLFWGIDRIDEDADGAFVFRALLVPGILLIWPLVLWRWRILATDTDQWARRYDPPRRMHPLAAFGMPVAILLVLVAGLSQRQEWPADYVPVQISQGDAG